MKAWIFAVGSEMLTPFRVDTNSLFITERLNAIGCDVRMKAVVGDDVDELSALFERGVGSGRPDRLHGRPRPDRGRHHARRRRASARICHSTPTNASSRRFEPASRQRGLVMREINRRQAMVPRGAVVLENARGTAPGLWLERERHRHPVAAGSAARDAADVSSVSSRSGFVRPPEHAVCSGACLKITGRPESDVDAVAQPVYAQVDVGARSRLPPPSSPRWARSNCT